MAGQVFFPAKLFRLSPLFKRRRVSLLLVPTTQIRISSSIGRRRIRIQTRRKARVARPDPLTKDPQYAHLNLEPGRQVSPSGAPRSRGVPTVYATLDTRRPHSHVTFDLRQSHSQASLGHELGYGEDSIHDLAYQHISHDTGRPLLAEDPTPALVAKRESSV
ncbi:hypothetical protein E2C01_060032 [Portunus trituberculatus]|uniref:Uncharacterized protein n=1 Tax=Portunus trituberculatus TaxID=210409 RepID=A0A5B7HAW4_PORTR|nr:hypothetical protein [Portunus trituberculatus]